MVTLQKIPRAFKYAGAMSLQGFSKFIPDRIGRNAVRRAFARSLVEMRGVPLKISQILSMSQNEVIAKLHRESLAEVPALPVAVIRSLVEDENPILIQSIRGLSEKGIAASLGQVHGADLIDGRYCALKVKYPGIHAHMDLDSSLMSLLIGTFGAFHKGFELDDYRAMLQSELKGELDYFGEANRQHDLWELFSNQSSIVIPKPYPAESGENHILMDWEASQPIAGFAQSASPTEKNDALNLLVDFFLHALFHGGKIHADPNPGNFGFRKSPELQLVVYDYGSVVDVPFPQAMGFLKLLQTVKHEQNPYADLVRLGFEPIPLQSIQSQLLPFCQIIFEPFLSENPFDLKQWNRKERVQSVLGAERWNFMVAAPAPLFLMIRAISGLFHYAGVLGNEFHLWPKIKAYSEAFKNQLTAFDSHRVNLDTENSGAAKSLKIELKKHGEKVVALTFPVSAVDRLESLLDPALAADIQAKGVSVSGCTDLAKKNGYKPMDLLEWSHAEKSLRVWLE